MDPSKLSDKAGVYVQGTSSGSSLSPKIAFALVSSTLSLLRPGGTAVCEPRVQWCPETLEPEYEAAFEGDNLTPLRHMLLGNRYPRAHGQLNNLVFLDGIRFGRTRSAVAYASKRIQQRLSTYYRAAAVPRGEPSSKSRIWKLGLARSSEIRVLGVSK